jgi:hypothetical protein
MNATNIRPKLKTKIYLTGSAKILGFHGIK